MKPRTVPIVVNSLVFVVACVLIAVAVALVAGTTGGGPIRRGCYAITDEAGRVTYATQPPQYNTQTGAVSFKTTDGSGWIFRPRRIDAMDACVAGQPVEPTPTPPGGA